MSINPSVLGYDDLKKNQIIKNYDESNFYYSSYNLRVGSIFEASTNKRYENYKIPPQGMVLVVSQETLDLPNDILAYTTVKNSMSIRGILAINIGLIDPNYKGPISSIVMNFGNKEFELKKGNTFLRLTFHKTGSSNKEFGKNQYKNNEVYSNSRSDTFRAHNSNKFLSLGKLSNQVGKQLGKKVQGLAIIVLSVLATFAAVFTVLDSKIITSSKEILMQEVLDELNTARTIDFEKLYLNKIDGLETKIDSLQTKVTTLESNIENE